MDRTQHTMVGLLSVYGLIRALEEQLGEGHVDPYDLPPFFRQAETERLVHNPVCHYFNFFKLTITHVCHLSEGLRVTYSQAA